MNDIRLETDLYGRYICYQHFSLVDSKKPDSNLLTVNIQNEQTQEKAVIRRVQKSWETFYPPDEANSFHEFY